MEAACALLGAPWAPHPVFVIFETPLQALEAILPSALCSPKPGSNRCPAIPRHAGSERIRSGAHGGSGVQGEHFKEACHINKSLTTLGRVINELVRSQQLAEQRRKGGPPVHVPYRDSRLTFLLQVRGGGGVKRA
jgi:hypothetical protein